jgi:hypothetical protein
MILALQMLWAIMLLHGCAPRCAAAPAQVLQDFHPDRQQPVKLVTTEYTAEIIPRPRDPGTGESRSIFRLVRQGRESVVSLPFQFYQVNAIIQAPAERVVVVGMLGGVAYELGIVDVAAGRLLDRFSCYNPSISSDGQYIAYTKFFAPHGVPSPDDHTMLYIVSKSAAQNRPDGVRPDDDIDVGFPLYPPGIENREADNVDVPAENAHVLSSYYVWKNSRELFFVDATPEQSRVVWVQVGGSVATVRDMVLPQTRIDKVKHYLSQGFVSVQFPDDLVRVTIKANAARPSVLDLSPADFASAGTVNLEKKR